MALLTLLCDALFLKLHAPGLYVPSVGQVS